MTPDPVEAVPSGPITSSPLPPIDGQPLPPPEGAPGTMMPGGTDVAGLPPAAAPAPAPAAPASRTSMVGGWTARDASGGTCRVQLSSTPALDLYRASTSGCSNQDLARINAWDYRDGEVYLYQTGGSVAARLRGSSGSLSGVLAKSGAPLSLGR
ncbi:MULTISPECIES: AprI/Inh family metalloprotease inhibitor [Microvirga]|uniref:AprI/Inh family metalloprotease inhibitor n=1 Tax=Microvirga TaxID=186650 RepID=UPI00299D4FFD|nr:AprI/Inh family metalloprotease inhibitor [Microvirga lenta]